MKRAACFVVLSVLLILQAASAQEPTPSRDLNVSKSAGAPGAATRAILNAAEAGQVFDQLMVSGAVDRSQSLCHSRPAWSGEQLHHPVWGLQRD
jgi:hypothetical protein